MNLPKLAVSAIRITIGVVAILLVAGSLFVWSQKEWYPIDVLAWHARNGNVAQIGEFNVPLSIWVRPAPHSSGLQFDLRHGKVGNVYVDLGGKVTTGDHWQAAWEANAKSTNPSIAKMAKHLLSAKTINLKIADQPSMCVEVDADIICVPEHDESGLTIRFFGSPELKPIFYETVSRITRTTRTTLK